MKHLLLKQNTTGIEIVTAKIIEKMYTLAKSEELDTSSTYEGNLQVTYTYEDSVSYLLGNKDDGTRRFPNLSINVTEGKYIRFEDPVVEQICATNWGNGTGITIAQAAAVSSIGTKYIFGWNSNITSFNEFKYFTNIYTLPLEAFARDTNLSSIELPPQLKNFESWSIFFGCGFTSFTINNPKNIGGQFFMNCLNLKKVNFIDYSLNYIPIRMFANTSLEEFVIPNSVLYIYDSAFRITKLKFLIIPENVIQMDGETFCGTSTYQYFIEKSTIPPSISVSTFDATNNCPIYVPDDSLSAYQSATNWSKYTSRIKAISMFPV